MSKFIIYQMLPRLWGNIDGKNIKNGTLEENRCGKFSNIDTITLDYLKSLGVSYVWLTGIIRHATAEDGGGCEPSSRDWVKGRAGSPYSITDYYDVNPYLADNPDDRMDEFKELVRRVHQAGLKVIIDFVPNHVARDYADFTASHPAPTGMTSLGEQDDSSVHWKEENDFFYYPGKALRLPVENQTYVEIPAKASGNAYTAEPGVNDWYDTIKLNYCDTPSRTWSKMFDIVTFWASAGVDGFRCDMVELVPPEFFKWLISRVKKLYPHIIFVAEVYQKTLYAKYIREVGFDLLYDKSGMYDAVRAIVEKNVNDSGVPVEAWQSTKRITWNWQFLGDLQPYMLNFLENHDEQRIASDYFAGNGSKAIPAMIVSACMNTNPVMIYFGQELGEHGMDTEGFSGRDGRTTIFDYWSVDSIRRWRNGGKFDNKFLNEDEKQLKQFYTRLLNICNSEKAIREGVFFDLTYANLAGWVFNEHKQYAFLRKQDDELILIMVNFDSIPARSAVNIPQHAFDYLGIHRYGEYEATELLTGNTEKLTLMPDKTTPVLLDGMNGKILKFKL